MTTINRNLDTATAALEAFITTTRAAFADACTTANLAADADDWQPAERLLEQARAFEAGLVAVADRHGVHLAEVVPDLVDAVLPALGDLAVAYDASPARQQAQMERLAEMLLGLSANG